MTLGEKLRAANAARRAKTVVNPTSEKKEEPKEAEPVEEGTPDPKSGKK